MIHGVQEYFMHVAFIRLGDIITVPGSGWLPFELTSLLQWLLYLLLPLAVLLWRLRVSPR